MIFITGDTHCNIDIHKLTAKQFKEQKHLTKKDYVIICGDFGAVWEGGNTDQYWQKWWKERNFTTLFVDGNHENHNLLNQYPIEEWNGGKVHFINESVIHLMRGQVYTIDGYKFFTMGGAESIDKQYRTPGKSWWPEELPSEQEYIEAVETLNRHNRVVDYIISHTASMVVMKQMNYVKEDNFLNAFLDMLGEEIQYKHWYFGHFHEDQQIDEKHTAVYNKVIRLI